MAISRCRGVFDFETDLEHITDAPPRWMDVVPSSPRCVSPRSEHPDTATEG